MQSESEVDPLHTELPDANVNLATTGGVTCPETLMPALDDVIEAYEELRERPAFRAEFNHLMKTYVGRPTPLTYARRLTESLGGAQIYLKREDLAHNRRAQDHNALGQALLAKRMGQATHHRRNRRRPARRGHGTACALRALSAWCIWAAVDMARQSPTYSVCACWARGTRRGERHEDTQRCRERGHSRLGGQRERHLLHHRQRPGAHPYPMMCRDFQSVIATKRANKSAAGRAAARRGDRLCGRRQQRHRIFTAFLNDQSN